MRRLLPLLVAGGLLLAACGSDTSDRGTVGTSAAVDATSGATSPQPTSAGPSATADTGVPTSTPEALQFDAVTIDGTPLDMAAYGGRTLALWFWAPT